LSLLKIYCVYLSAYIKQKLLRVKFVFLPCVKLAIKTSER